MTNEETINVLSTHREHWERLLDDGICDKREGAEFIEACDMAIQALEQGDLLDKIRAEIEERKLNSGGEPNRELAFNVCLQIIDKYKAESEEV